MDGEHPRPRVLASQQARSGAGELPVRDATSRFEIHSGARIGGIHPHSDRKSPEAIERKGVAGVHCTARVRNRQKAKEIDVGKGRFAIRDSRHGRQTAEPKRAGDCVWPGRKPPARCQRRSGPFTSFPSPRLSASRVNRGRRKGERAKAGTHRWSRSITTYGSTRPLNCQVILSCSMRSNEE
jgi:hypothetical protein